MKTCLATAWAAALLLVAMGNLQFCGAEVGPKSTVPNDLLSWETLDRQPGLQRPVHSDPNERSASAKEFKAVADSSPLVADEMPAYWRLMRWSRVQDFSELLKEARREGVDVFFKDLIQNPATHRGDLIRLDLHVKRVLSFPAPKNPTDVKTVYEAWGVTEDARANPYVVIFGEKPPELPTGASVSEEATFVGYFLKDLSYMAINNQQRSAPLLVGRLRLREAAGPRDEKDKKQPAKLPMQQPGAGQAEQPK